MAMTVTEWSRLRELHRLLEQHDLSIEDAIEAHDHYTHAVELIERAWVYMLLRDRMGKMTEEWKKLNKRMWDDLKTAQGIARSVRRK